MSVLYVVGTPIGNLNDMSVRAVETLKSVDFIAAEDTRVTLKLLNHFDIKKPMISYYEHNIRERGNIIIDRILSGESCAIVSDAGMPCISDPGEDLVRLCSENNIDVKVIPGPSAAISALCISGMNTSRFTFEGFLSTSKKSRAEHLESLKDERRTMIFYEAPHKLKNTLEDLKKCFGDSRKISLCRELTKLHEEVLRFNLSEATEYFESITPKGEFVLILEGKPLCEEEVTLDEAVNMARELVKGGQKLTEAAKTVAKNTSFNKAKIYKELIEE